LENLKSTGLKGIRGNFDGLKILETEESIFNSNGNKKHRELAEKLNEIIVEVNREGRVVYANKNAFKKTGFTKEDVNVNRHHL